MTLKEIMKFNNFAVVGNTIDKEKYGYKIKEALLEQGYNVYPVYKELKSLNDIKGELDVVVLVINAVKGLEIIRECKVKYKVVLIQPGAESKQLIDYLEYNNIEYLEGCALVGLKLR